MISVDSLASQPHKLTYKPAEWDFPWRCANCGAMGALRVPIANDCLKNWGLVLAAHEDEIEWGRVCDTADIVIDEPREVLPE